MKQKEGTETNKRERERERERISEYQKLYYQTKYRSVNRHFLMMKADFTFKDRDDNDNWGRKCFHWK